MYCSGYLDCKIPEAENRERTEDGQADPDLVNWWNLGRARADIEGEALEEVHKCLTDLRAVSHVKMK